MNNSILARPVTPEEMLEAARRMGDPNAEASQAGLLELAHTMLEQDPEKLVAIMVRMKALVKLLDHPMMRAWAQNEQNDTGVAYFSEPIVRVAADHPMVGGDSDLSFDADAFFARVLEVTEEEGHG